MVIIHLKLVSTKSGTDHLARLVIKNFRKLAYAELTFQPGLNVFVGGNNVGKTAVVDALRALLAGHDEPYPRVGELE